MFRKIKNDRYKMESLSNLSYIFISYNLYSCGQNSLCQVLLILAVEFSCYLTLETFEQNRIEIWMLSAKFEWNLLSLSWECCKFIFTIMYQRKWPSFKKMLKRCILSKLVEIDHVVLKKTSFEGHNWFVYFYAVFGSCKWAFLLRMFCCPS